MARKSSISAQSSQTSSTSDANSIVAVESLVKQYDGVRVVDGVTFNVREGEIFGILGPNGAGKTSTIEMIEQIRQIDGGSVTLDGFDAKKDTREIKKRIGVQLQSSAFFDYLQLDELLVMYGSLYGAKVDSDALLAKVQLSEKKKSYVNQLSGGQKQRFSVAVALVNEPRVLFLDEPTTGLDPQARRNLWDLIEEIKADKITVVMTTHYMEEAEKLCDRVAIMDNGRVLVIDTPNNLISDLVERGFKGKKQLRVADLEDVFIDLTGKALRE